MFIPGALAFIWEQIKARKISQKTLIKFDKVLGLNIAKNIKIDNSDIPDKILKMITERDKARKNKEWATSDKIREQLEFLGYEIKDTNKGTRLIKT